MSQPPPTPSGGSCRNCFTTDHFLLHHIKHRGEFKHVCTCCVLKLHPSSFCPTCFTLHDPTCQSLNPPILSTTNPSSSSKSTLTCFKCSSISHAACVPPTVPKSPYLCPPCSNPSVRVFDVRRSGDGGEKVLDERAARVFLAAARIAAISMNRAAAVARENAERRVRDAALARKRAKEAIDHVMALSAKFAGNKRRETPSAAVAGGGGGEAQAALPITAKCPNGAPVKIEKNNANQMKVEL